eukprot:15360618-Ditylum_brightwellii.AAC.1
MGVTVRKSPVVLLFGGWFDEHTYFKLDKASSKVSYILDLIYSTLSECKHEKADNESVEEFDDKVKQLMLYSTNAKSKSHYQCYTKQYQDYMKTHSKLKLGSLVNVANFKTGM